MHLCKPFTVAALVAILLAAAAADAQPAPTAPTHSNAASATAVAAPALAATSAAISGYRGEARDGTGTLIYVEQDFVWDGGTRRLTLYRCPDGQPFARRQDDARGGDPAAPDFDAFVRRHFDVLRAGITVPVAFLVPSHLKTINFKITRIDDARAAAHDEVAFRLELGSWFGFLLPHIDVRYDAQTRALRRYVGLSNLRDARGDNLKVSIDFPPAQARSDIPRTELAAAQRVALDGRCPLR